MAGHLVAGTIDPAEMARCLFDESSDALLIFEPVRLRIQEVNPLAQKLTKRRRKQLLEMTVTDLFVSDDPHVFAEFLDSCQETRIYHSRESHQLIRAGGELMEVNVSVSRLHTRPSPLGVVSVRDVSDRKKLEADLKATKKLLEEALADKSTRLDTAEEQLDESEERFRELLDDIDAIVWEADEDCRFRFVSRQAEKILGYPVEAWISRQNFFFEIVHSEDVDELQEQCLLAKQDGQDHEMQFRAVSKSGDVVWLRNIVHVVKASDGSVDKLRGVMIDVTSQVDAELKRADLDQKLRRNERQLAHVSRLSTMGEMVAGISHEINQPLSAIANYAAAASRTFEREYPSGNEDLARWMNQIAELAVSCGEIVRRIRGYTGRITSPAHPIPVDEAARQAAALVSDILEDNDVELFMDIDDSLEIHMSEVEIQQVLVNLLRNACDSLVEAQVECRQITVRAQRDPDGGTRDVIIRVSDNGPGVTEEASRRMFDPFFTTRQEGMGMGLGISRSIVRSYQGEIWQESDENGATFFIRFPAASEVRI